jgi:hypothetical protein
MTGSGLTPVGWRGARRYRKAACGIRLPVAEPSRAHPVPLILCSSSSLPSEWEIQSPEGAELEERTRHKRGEPSLSSLTQWHEAPLLPLRDQEPPLAPIVRVPQNGRRPAPARLPALTLKEAGLAFRPSRRRRNLLAYTRRSTAPSRPLRERLRLPSPMVVDVKVIVRAKAVCSLVTRVARRRNRGRGGACGTPAAASAERLRSRAVLEWMTCCQ